MGRRAKKGYRARPQVPINAHAIDRFREHWPAANYLYDSEVRFLLSEQILDALERDDFIIAPGGIYVPITVMDEDGYAVLVEQQVHTVMPLQYCKEVDQVRRNKERA
jgi:hypothetical protein